MEHKGLYNMKEDVPDDTGPMELGKAIVRREGKDVTIVAVQLMMHRSLKAAEKLAAEGIHAEVIDLRSMVPMDKKTILDSIAKTNRLVVAQWKSRLIRPVGEAISSH